MSRIPGLNWASRNRLVFSQDPWIDLHISSPFVPSQDSLTKLSINWCLAQAPDFWAELNISGCQVPAQDSSADLNISGCLRLAQDTWASWPI